MSIEQTIETVVERAVLEAFEPIRDELKRQNSFPEIMTLTQVAEYTQYTRQTILRFIKEQGFPVSNRCERPRFVKSEVDRWLKGEI